jgi:hypothetical protein
MPLVDDFTSAQTSPYSSNTTTRSIS